MKRLCRISSKYKNIMGKGKKNPSRSAGDGIKPAGLSKFFEFDVGERIILLRFYGGSGLLCIRLPVRFGNFLE